MSRANPRFRRTNPQLPAAPANTWEVIIYGTIDNQMTINTFYYIDSGGVPGPSTAQNLANAWLTANKTLMSNCVSADWTFTQIKVGCLTLPSYQPYVAPLSGSGNGPAGHQPSTDAITVTRYTGTRGQSGRGRILLPAVPTTWAVNSVLTASAITTLSLNIIFILNEVTVSSINYFAALVSMKNKLGPKLGAAVLNTLLLRTIIGSCRRRKIGRGK